MVKRIILYLIVTDLVSFTKTVLIMQFIDSLPECQRPLTKLFHLSNLKVLPFLTGFQNPLHTFLAKVVLLKVVHPLMIYTSTQNYMVPRRLAQILHQPQKLETPSVLNG